MAPSLDDLFLGVDLGTTAVKVCLFDGRGRPRAAAAREFRMETPAPGFAEFDADAYMACAFDGMREVLAARGPATVRAIGLSSQAQTFVLINADHKPVRPAVGWLDVRAQEEARELSGVAARLGLPAINAIASGPKILWLRRREPASIERAVHVLLLPDYLIFRLTGARVSDPVTASSTGLTAGAAGGWSAGLLDACGLRPGMMPAVAEPGATAGTVTPAVARELGLPPGTLVAVGANDQLTGALGAGNAAPGCASLALGTALAIIVSTDRCDGSPAGVAVFPHAVKGLYAMLAYAKTAGIVLRWFRDAFAPSLSYDDLFAEAARVEIGAEGVSCIPHFSGAATPTFDSSVRGAFAGLTLAHGRPHMVRAIAEALAFTVRENMDLLARAGGRAGALRAIGGGAKSDVWLQMIADATGVPVERPAVSEAACLGAAELAMTAAGLYTSAGQASLALYRVDRRFEPDPAARPAYDAAFQRYRGLYQALYGKQDS
jgi:xylulokinase